MTDGPTYGRTDLRTDRPTNGPTDGPTDGRTNPLIEMLDASKNDYKCKIKKIHSICPSQNVKASNMSFER